MYSSGLVYSSGPLYSSGLVYSSVLVYSSGLEYSRDFSSLSEEFASFSETDKGRKISKNINDIHENLNLGEN